MDNNGIYHHWVPQPLQTILTLIFGIPLILTSGIYTSNIPKMIGETGGISDIFSMANYASIIGVTAVVPLCMRLRTYFSTKNLVIGSLLTLSLLSLICYKNNNPSLFIILSFFIGGVRMIGMLNFLTPLLLLFSSTRKRTEYYPKFWPIAIALALISNYLFSALSINTEWRNVYLLAIIYLLVCTLLAIIFIHNKRTSRKVPLHQFHWLSMLLYTTSMLVLNYVIVCAKNKEYLQSPEIRAGIIIFIILIFIFIAIQKILKRPYLSLNAFSIKNVWLAYLFFVLMGLFLSSSSILSIFMIKVLRYSGQTCNYINLSMIPGVIVGGIICAQWFKYKLKLNGLIMLGFGAFIISHLLLSFLFTPIIQIENFSLPLIFKGMGMCIIYISASIYCLDNLKEADIFSAVSIMLIFRSFIGPALFNSIISWAMYKFQWQNTFNIAGDIDSANNLICNKSIINLYSRIQIQSILVTAKQLYEYIVIIGFVILFFIGFYSLKPNKQNR